MTHNTFNHNLNKLIQILFCINLCFVADIVVDDKADLFYLLLYIQHSLFCNIYTLLPFIIKCFSIVISSPQLGLFCLNFLFIVGLVSTIIILIAQLNCFNHCIHHDDGADLFFHHLDVVKAFENIP